MAPLIHPAHLGLRSLGHHDGPPDVDLDPIARFMLVFVISFLIVTSLVVVLKLLGICLLACMIGCRSGRDERHVVYRVYQPIPQLHQPQPHPPPQAQHQDNGDQDAPPPPYTPHGGPKNYGSTS